MKKQIKSLIVSVLCCVGLAGVQANASGWQVSMPFDSDESSWSVHTNLNSGGYVANDAANARSGTKSGFVYSISGWSGIGRNVVLSAWSIRNYSLCGAGIYAKGLASYFEVIDTQTWTYLRPLAHSSGGDSYKNVLSGGWKPIRPNVFIRYVANAGTSGSFKYAYVDDAVVQCNY